MNNFRRFCGFSSLTFSLAIGLAWFTLGPTSSVVGQAIAPAADAPAGVPVGAPANNGVKPAAATVTLTLNLYDGGAVPFLTATRPIAMNTNAFDALRSIVNVQFTTYPPNLAGTPPFPGGPFVTGLCGLRPANPKFWALYVDGNFSNVGIGAITITKDISIDFKVQ